MWLAITTSGSDHGATKLISDEELRGCQETSRRADRVFVRWLGPAATLATPGAHASTAIEVWVRRNPSRTPLRSHPPIAIRRGNMRKRLIEMATAAARR